MRPKVMVIGIDGVRLDTLHRAPTPNLDAITSTGFLTPVRIRDTNPTISGPCWATIATGVHADQHGITGNDLTGNRLHQHPCFLARAAAAGHRTYAAAGWLPLLTEHQGGPIFRAHDHYTPPRPLDSPTGGDAISDNATTTAATTALTTTDPDIAFIYFGQTDEVAHHHGTGDQYTRAITNTDTCLGRIRDAVATRTHYHHEQWTWLVVTDHGHRDGGGHGGNSDLERTAWIAGTGPGLDTNPTGLEHADIPRLALTPLGIT